MKYFLQTTLAILCTISFSGSHASTTTCTNTDSINQSKTLSGLIEESNFIGLYAAKEVTKGSGGEHKGTYRNRYEVVFELQRTIANSAPEELISQTAFEVLHNVPASYFSLERRHQKIVNKDSLSFGRDSRFYSDMDGNCFAAPEVVVGYTYLIFGDTYSPITFEPILDRKYDALYLTVIEKVRHMNGK